MTKTFLILDDYHKELMGPFLKEDGHSVLLYQDRKELLRDIEQGLEYSLAVIDCETREEVFGKEVIARMKELYPTRPIIAVSMLEQTAANAGADDYMVKAFRPSSLALKAYNMLGIPLAGTCLEGFLNHE